MGISGLLPALKSIQKPRHIKKWAGQKVAVDGYGWLHRGTISCPIELALEKPTVKYVEFAMNRVRMLLHYGVIPYMVFDGDYLPSKAGEESERARKREASKKAGLDLLRQGKTSQAYLELQKAVDVSPKMARQLIDACQSLGVQCLVAPYEADAQMYYLERNGIVSAIISEDSDLLVFGCKNLITKLDQYGECIEICRDDFAACKELSLASWTDDEFRCMAILSGCDYLQNIPRMGLKTAYRFVRKYRSIDKVIKAMRFDGSFRVPDNYLEAFRQANLTFRHQRVFCPIANKLVMCTEPEHPLSDEELVFIGPDIEEEVAQAVASGDLDPITKEKIVIRSASPVSHMVKASTWSQRKSLLKQTKAKQTIASFFIRSPLQQSQPNRLSVPPNLPMPNVERKRPLLSELPSTSAYKKTKHDRAAEEKENHGPESSRYFQPPKCKQSRSPIPAVDTPSKRLSTLPARNLTSFAFVTTPQKRSVSTYCPSSQKEPLRSNHAGNNYPTTGDLTTPSPPRSASDPHAQVDGQCSPTLCGSSQTVLSVSPLRVIPDTPPKIRSGALPCEQAVSETPQLPTEKHHIEDSALKSVIQGWRDRYSFQSTTFASKPCVTPKQSEGIARLTPLQRIGAAALCKTSNVRRSNARSIQRTCAANSPRRKAVVQQKNSNYAEVEKAKPSLDRFLHTP